MYIYIFKKMIHICSHLKIYTTRAKKKNILYFNIKLIQADIILQLFYELHITYL